MIIVTATGGLQALLAGQARACAANGSPMYAALLDALAADVAAGGLTAELLAAYASASPDDMVPLRLMGALHRLVLEREAPELALHYPSVGGRFASADAAWPAVQATLGAHGERLRGVLEQVPQTNEVGRAAALAGLLRHAVARSGLHQVRLVELGASAGLNLCVDRFRIGRGDGAWGPAHSPVDLGDAWLGQQPPAEPVRIVERAGVDLAPVDVTSANGRLALTSFVWADQVERFERLRAALSVAGDARPPVQADDAVEFAERLELREGMTTVVWHSVFRPYLPQAARARLSARLEDLGRQASPTAGFAEVSLEPAPEDVGSGRTLEVRLRTGVGPMQVLGTAPPHGVPVTWSGG